MCTACVLTISDVAVCFVVRGHFYTPFKIRLETKTCLSVPPQLRETDANLGKSSRILTGMLRR